MRKRLLEDREHEVLPEHVASRLLTRASELDAARRASAAVAELRAAATEAGISSAAFDAALSELREEAQLPQVRKAPTRRFPVWKFTVAVTAILAIGVVRALFPPAGPARGMEEEAFLLRCLTPGQAAELLRPHLRLPENAILHGPHAPGVLTIHGTPEQLRGVRTLLDKYEGNGSSCDVPPPAAIGERK
ncbi:MAG: hypothetical protein AB1762_09720 [Gemmatimonadota bacterium]